MSRKFQSFLLMVDYSFANKAMHADTQPRREYLEAFSGSSLAAWLRAGDDRGWGKDYNTGGGNAGEVQ